MAFDVRGDLLRDIFALREAMDRLVRGSFERLTAEPVFSEHGTIPIDVAEDETGYTVFAALPGVTADHLEIQAHGNTLVIRGDRPHDDEQRWLVREQVTAEIYRTVTLPNEVNAEAASADLANGVLTITLPKRPEAQPVRIPVSGRTAQGVAFAIIAEAQNESDAQDSFSVDTLAVVDEAPQGVDVDEPATEIEANEGEFFEAETGFSPVFSIEAFDVPSFGGEGASAIAETPFRTETDDGGADRSLADLTAKGIFVDVIAFVDSTASDTDDDAPASALDRHAAIPEAFGTNDEGATESDPVLDDGTTESGLGHDAPVAESAATIGDVALEPADTDFTADVAASIAFTGAFAPARVEAETTESDDTELNIQLEKAS